MRLTALLSPLVATLLLGAALAGTSLAGCAAATSPGGEGGGDPAPTTASGTTGAGMTTPEGTTPQVYLERCASCHGQDGEGGKLAPQILGPVVGYATYVVRTGRAEMGYPGAMPSFTASDVSEAELTETLTWLRAAKKPEDGKGLFVRFCANCHGSDGLGGRVGEGLVKKATKDGAGELIEAVREGHHEGAFGDREEYMPAWPEEEITDAEVEAITGYLQTLPGGGSGSGGDDDDDD